MSFFFFFSQKRQLSAQSLAFNLKDKVFCELFPDVVDVSIRAFLGFGEGGRSSATDSIPIFSSSFLPGDEAETEGPGGA